jgi:hypothetical protein
LAKVAILEIAIGKKNGVVQELKMLARMLADKNSWTRQISTNRANIIV